MTPGSGTLSRSPDPLMLLLLLACADEPGDSGSKGPHGGRDSADDSGTDSGGDSGDDSGRDTEGETGADTDTGLTRAEEVCQRWAADRADLSEGSWTGNTSNCDAGDISGRGRENALRLTNLYRWMAGQPEVTDDPTRNAAAQECALMEHLHGSLSHYPDASWACYTAEGAGAAGSSNIASAAAVYAVDMYMLDWGNETTIGHRRWLLSNQLGPVGIGSTNQYSCMWVIYGSGGGTAPWVAWPPPGPIPEDAFFDGGGLGVDDTGWTLQSDSIDLSRATVTITSGGVDKPVTVSPLLSGYGSTYAIKMLPRGWRVHAGETYTVQVGGTSPAISYDVEVVGCGR